MDIRDALFDEVYNIAKNDKDVVFITADADAFSLHKFKEDFPDRFINVGVAEQAMVNIASGLALSGKKVFIYAIIPFITMRVYEQIKVTICSMNLPITIIGAGAGLSFSNDGPTHHAIQDISIMRTLPEISIYNPFDAFTAKNCILEAYNDNKPSYIRLDKGEFPDSNYSLVNGIAVRSGTNNRFIVCTGTIYHNICDIDKESTILSCFRLKPFNKEIVFGKRVIVIEENAYTGGLGSIIRENIPNLTFEHYCLPDKQIFEYGSREYLLSLYGLDEKGLKKSLGEIL